MDAYSQPNTNNKGEPRRGLDTATPPLVVAIVGATGAVGSLMARELATMDALNTGTTLEIRLFASKRSAGTKINLPATAGLSVNPIVQELTESSFKGVDIALFAAGATVSRRYAPLAVGDGAVVIDNSSAFRTDATIPLVVPEVNAASIIRAGVAHAGVAHDSVARAGVAHDSVAHADNRGEQHHLPTPPMIIANPNCVAIISAVAINPLHHAYGLESVEMTTFQSASGAGMAAMNELVSQASSFTTMDDLSTLHNPRNPDDDGATRQFAHPLLFNVIPQIGDFHGDGTTEEEDKIRFELQKILQTPVRCTATCVRVPTLTSHSMSIALQFRDEFTLPEVEAVLRNAPGVVLYNNHLEEEYPMPLVSSNTHKVYVGRLRKDKYDPKRLHMFVSGDQLRKGAAINALQILELAIK